MSPFSPSGFSQDIPMERLLVIVLCPVVASATRDNGRSELLLNYISPLALGIAGACAAIIAIAVVVACYFDNKGQKGLPKSSAKHPPSVWEGKKMLSHEPVHPATPSQRQSKSSEETVTAIDVDDLAADMEQRAQMRSLPSSRLDPTAKHNMIIEAIYRVSKRELPEAYSKHKGGAADVHAIRSAGQALNALNRIINPLETIEEEIDSTPLTEAVEREKDKTDKEVTAKTSDARMTTEKEEEKSLGGKDLEEKKMSKESLVEVKKDGSKENLTEEKKEKAEEKKEEGEDKTAVERSVEKGGLSKEKVLMMEEMKEDRKRVEEKKKDEETGRKKEGEGTERDKTEKTKTPTEREDTEKTTTEQSKTEKTEAEKPNEKKDASKK